MPGRLSLLQLRELAAAEDVVKAREADYVEAIYNPPDVLVAGARDKDEEDMEVPCCK